VLPGSRRGWIGSRKRVFCRVGPGTRWGRTVYQTKFKVQEPIIIRLTRCLLDLATPNPGPVFSVNTRPRWRHSKSHEHHSSVSWTLASCWTLAGRWVLGSPLDRHWSFGWEQCARDEWSRTNFLRALMGDLCPEMVHLRVNLTLFRHLTGIDSLFVGELW
jgi:hypothetical protein